MVLAIASSTATATTVVAYTATILGIEVGRATSEAVLPDVPSTLVLPTVLATVVVVVGDDAPVGAGAVEA